MHCSVHFYAKNTFSFIIVYLLVLVKIFGQAGERMNILSPQTYEFMKNGNVPAAHYTGETNVQIPVYTYKDKDFEFPIYLGYNSSGFIPNKREGIVGMNWFLNAGGSITRKVNGVPDELIGTGTSVSPTTLHGYWRGIKDQLGGAGGIKDLTPATMMTCPNTQCISVTPTLYAHKNDCEIDLDQFNFNMPGHSGQFLIKNSRDDVYGDARCVGNKPYYIDLSGLSTQSYSWTNIQGSSIIKITSPDGYLYEFGGSVQNLEISYRLNSAGEPQAYPVINAWHLTKITAPNGRQAFFSYKTFTPGFNGINHPPDDDNHYLLNIQQEEYGNGINSATVNGSWLQSYSNSSSSGIATFYEATKTVYLESITVDKTEILFSYSTESQTLKFYKNPPGAPNAFDQFNFNLDAINVLYGPKPANINFNDDREVVKSVSLGYAYKGGSVTSSAAYPRLFLTHVTESGSNPYILSYYKVSASDTDLPNPLTHGIDYWGFWKGGTSTTTPLIPNATFDPNSDIHYTAGGVREPNAALYNVGLLEKIIYPTKGSTTFIYEPHTYSQRLERRAAQAFLPALYPVNGTAGGARIKKIIDNDGLKDQKVREFIYTKNYPSTASSSGILLEWPRYIYYWRSQSGSQTIQTLQKKSNSFHSNYYPGEKYIHYAEVTELQLPANGYTNYKFSNYETNPNVRDDRGDYYYNTFYSTIPDPDQRNLYNNYIGIKLSDKSFQRGLPYEVSDYALSGGIHKLVKRKTTLYTISSNYPNHYLAGLLTSGSVLQLYKIYTYPFMPISETEQVYNSDFQSYSSTTTSYTYNDFNLLTEQAAGNSKGEIVRTKFRYSSDFYFDPQGLYPALPEVEAMLIFKNKRIYSAPVEQYWQIQQPGSSTIRTISSQLLLYTPNSTKPNKVYHLESDSPILNFSPVTITGNTSLVKNSSYKLKATMTYAANNLVQLDKPAGETVSYIWGYNGLHPVAEVANASATDIAYCGFESSQIVTKSGPPLHPVYTTTGDASGGWAGTNPSPGPPLLAKAGIFGWQANLTRTITKLSTVSVWSKQSATAQTPPTSLPYIAGLTPKLTYVSNDGWTYVEWEVSPGTFSINNNNNVLDEARCYPVGVQMKTYTYRAHIGLTSACDPNNSFTRYYYDDYSRLSYLKDDKGNILKKYSYQYAQ